MNEDFKAAHYLLLSFIIFISIDNKRIISEFTKYHEIS